MAIAIYVQYSKREDKRYTHFLPQRHVQVPNDSLGEEEDNDIGDKVNSSGGNFKFGFLDACPGDSQIPGLPEGDACKA